MSDPAKQIGWHLASLRAAGIEWVAVGEPPPLPEPAAEVEAVQTSLFAAAAPASSVPDADSPEGRRQALQVLAQRVAACTRCPQLASTRTQTVFGIGPLSPDLCFVGEAPGADEDRLGEPFVGAAGQLLNRIITACRLKREEVFICNILRCRPPGNRQPNPDEADNCREYLEQTLELIKPRFLCALGGSATKFLLGTSIGITRLRGKWMAYRGIPVMCTFHPSYLLRNPEAKRDVWEDMKVLLARMGKPVPGVADA